MNTETKTDADQTIGMEEKRAPKHKKTREEKGRAQENTQNRQILRMRTGEMERERERKKEKQQTQIEKETVDRVARALAT